MNGTQAQTMHTHTTTETKVATGSSMFEAFGAIATIALAIVGLAGIFSQTMAGIAAMVLGASLVAESGISLSGFGFGRGAGYPGNVAFAFEEETGSKVLGGLAGIVLGILALLGLSPGTLLAVSVLVFGGTFLLGGQLLAGVSGVVLGILAVVGIDPWTLILVGLLTLGAWSLLRGSTFTARAMSASAA